MFNDTAQAGLPPIYGNCYQKLPSSKRTEQEKKVPGYHINDVCPQPFSFISKQFQLP